MCYAETPQERRQQQAMRGLRFKDIESKPYVVLDMTSLVVEEFRALVEPFEEEFQAHMAKWRLDGLPRTKRSYSTYKNCPLPTAEDRLLFVLTYLKNNPLQTMHGCTFGMAQCKTNVWLHVLLPVLKHTLESLELTPARSMAELAGRLKLNIEQASQVLDSSCEETPKSTSTESSPLFVMMEQSEWSRAPRTRMIRSSITAARKRGTR
jgi:hypothetical protein